jgi:hypothetical protein
MGCCGKKRAAVPPAGRPNPQVIRADARENRLARPVSQRPEPPRIGAAAAPASLIAVRYVGAQRIRVRGTATGSIYHCSASSRMLSVNVRDAPALLRTGLFTA